MSRAGNFAFVLRLGGGKEIFEVSLVEFRFSERFCFKCKVMIECDS